MRRALGRTIKAAEGMDPGLDECIDFCKQSGGASQPARQGDRFLRWLPEPD